MLTWRDSAASVPCGEDPAALSRSHDDDDARLRPLQYNDLLSNLYHPPKTVSFMLIADVLMGRKIMHILYLVIAASSRRNKADKAAVEAGLRRPKSVLAHDHI
jgi:hypothetical protein